MAGVPRSHVMTVGDMGSSSTVVVVVYFESMSIFTIIHMGAWMGVNQIAN